MARYFLNPFAVAGDKTPIPNGVQVDGSVSYASGFGPAYQGNLPTDPTARAVPRSPSNQLYYDITSNIQQYQQFGFPEFITTADNGGVPFAYSKNVVVRYDDGGGYQFYVSLVDDNEELPTNATNWSVIDFTRVGPYVGEYRDFSYGTIEPGWLECNFAEVSRTTYAALFAKIGTLYGPGNDTTTFNIPDFRRMVPMGRGGTAVFGPANTLASVGGAEGVALVEANNGPHTHQYGSPAVGLGVIAAGFDYLNTSGLTGSSGSGTPHNNVQPSLVVVVCIYTGVF